MVVRFGLIFYWIVLLCKFISKVVFMNDGGMNYFNKVVDRVLEKCIGRVCKCIIVFVINY